MRHVDEATRAAAEARKAASERPDPPPGRVRSVRPDRTGGTASRSGGRCGPASRAPTRATTARNEASKRHSRWIHRANNTAAVWRTSVSNTCCSPRTSGSRTRRTCWKRGSPPSTRTAAGETHCQPLASWRCAPSPGAPRILLERYDRDPVTERRRATAVQALAGAPSATSLPPGSYRLVIDGAGLARCHPAVRDQTQRTHHRRPDRAVLSAVPKGFVYIPAGTFWYGDADEQLRTQFLDTVPIHRRTTGAYFVARDETTYQDWITFLDGITAVEQLRHAPVVSGTIRGALALRRGADGWHLAIQPSSRRYEANAHEPIRYTGRNRRARQDWLRFPIGGISPDDTARYLAWLRESGRLPGARLCSEPEWERAARGADDRLFPHGDDLPVDDANFDLTYHSSRRRLWTRRGRFASRVAQPVRRGGHGWQHHGDGRIG